MKETPGPLAAGRSLSEEITGEKRDIKTGTVPSSIARKRSCSELAHAGSKLRHDRERR